MMEHDDYKRFLLSDPSNVSDEMKAHAARCAECAAFTARLERFEGRLASALRVELPTAMAPLPAVPERLVRETPHRASGWRGRSRSRWFAVAASVLVTLLAGGGLWLASPRPSLAADVVAHMAEEPQAWARVDTPVSEPKLAAVMGDSHMRLRPGGGLVSYASSCLFRGHHVPHLVVQSSAGPVTVMVLVHEGSSRVQNFDEAGYRGTIVPVPGHGSLAVLTKTPDFDASIVNATAARVLDSIDWSG